jgi:hypothetical protein
MTPELKWLMYTALLAGSLWIPFIIGVNITDFPGMEQQFARPPDHDLRPGALAAAPDDLLRRLDRHARLCLASAQGCLKELRRLATGVPERWESGIPSSSVAARSTAALHTPHTERS